MAEQDITDLRNSSKVSSVQRGTLSDWIVITEFAAGPQPNPVEVFADHAAGYEVIGSTVYGDDEHVRVAEVAE